MLNPYSASPSPGRPPVVSSAPTRIALAASGSARFSFRSRKISTVWYGEEDQIVRRRGKEMVRRTSLERRSESEVYWSEPLAFGSAYACSVSEAGD